jgi:hypothetical protein
MHKSGIDLRPPGDRAKRRAAYSVIDELVSRCRDYSGCDDTPIVARTPGGF